MLIKKRKALLYMLLLGSITPFKQLIVLAGICLPLVGKIKKQELARFSVVCGILIVPLTFSAYYAPTNLATSLLLLFPFLYIVFFPESAVSALHRINIKAILDFFVYLLIFNGLIGLVQYAFYQHDDAAIGFYGRSGLRLHGLAILYFMAALFILSKQLSTLNLIKAGLLLVFMLSCFYGAGLVAVAISLTISSFLYSKNKIRTFLISIAVAFLVVILGWLISAKTMIYNYNIILLFFESIWNIVLTGTADTYGMPRKIAAWILYIQASAESLHNLVTGFGAGTFNSRAAFLLNGDYTSLAFLPISLTDVHRHYIMPLWSSHMLSQAYSDGTMNQPFSSVLAILSEYGVIALSLVFLGYRRLQRIVLGMTTSESNKSRFIINTIFIFFGTLCLFDNILEYPEIVVPFFLFTIGVKSNA